jgi:hypothetical protein
MTVPTLDQNSIKIVPVDGIKLLLVHLSYKPSRLVRHVQLSSRPGHHCSRRSQVRVWHRLTTTCDGAVDINAYPGMRSGPCADTGWLPLVQMRVFKSISLTIPHRNSRFDQMPKNSDGLSSV